MRHFAHHVTLLLARFNIEHVITNVRLSHNCAKSSQTRKSNGNPRTKASKEDQIIQDERSAEEPRYDFHAFYLVHTSHIGASIVAFRLASDVGFAVSHFMVGGVE
jgi:hypothetical protein